MKLKQLIDDATSRLAAAGVASPAYDASLIAAEFLDVSRMSLRLVRPEELPDGFEARYEEAIRRREAREPLQHILGTAPFGTHDLRVGPGVFIPRPETEVLAEWAVQTLTSHGAGPSAEGDYVVDLGTGSGALAIYIAERVSTAHIIAVDISREAIAAAKENSAGVGSIRVVEGDMTDPELLARLSGSVSLIVANPPYVPYVPQAAGVLEPEVYRDPENAVFSGDDGMDAIQGLIPVAARLLKPGGWIGIEHDDSTAALTRQLVEDSGAFDNVRSLTDLTGRERFVTASKLK